MIPSAYSVYLLSTSIYPDLQYISEYVLFDQGYKLKALKVKKIQTGLIFTWSHQFSKPGGGGDVSVANRGHGDDRPVQSLQYSTVQSLQLLLYSTR